MKSRCLLTAAGTALWLAVPVLSAHAQGAIAVQVNGTPIAFSGTPPQQVHGSVLVPLRGVFEALGASVNYNGATRTIEAHKGATTIILPIGASSAVVNGQPRALSQPAAVMGGTTLVPLRFVAEALGAYVDWAAATRTVQIKTDEPHLATLPSPPGEGDVTGQVTGIFTNTNPTQVTLRVNGQNTVVALSPNTIILRSAPGQPGTQVPLASIREGDQVTVHRDASGTATAITATYGEVRGTVRSIGTLASGNSVITLNDGTTVEVVKGAPVTMDKRTITLKDVMPDEAVVIRTNPSNSLGFGVALATGTNPNPTPAVAPRPAGGTVAVSVDSFTIDAPDTLRAGQLVKATLVGTPGAKASFAIPGIAENVPMQETSPGTYAGSYTVPENVTVTGAAVIGRIAAGGSSLLAQAAHKVTVDSVPPKVESVSPASGATVATARPLIYGTFSDGAGTGVDPATVKITVDGKDITSDATITSAFFNVTPQAPLSRAAHTVAVTASDRAGNQGIKTWSFDVAPTTEVGELTSSVAAGQAVGANQDIQFTLQAAPGGKATFDVGTLATRIPMTEKAPGTYVGVFSPAAGDNLKNAPVTATFVDAAGKSVTTSLAGGVTVTGGAPIAPKITEPQDNAVVADTLTVSGTAAPGTTIRVSVTYQSKALGGLLAVNGAAGSQEVPTDAQGHWTVRSLPLKSGSLFGLDRDTSFTVSAVSVSASGETSDATTITVRHG